MFVKENAVNLSRKEYAILEYLMMNKGRIVSNEELIEHIWESQADTFTNAFKVHIHGLRKTACDLDKESKRRRVLCGIKLI